MMSFKQFLIKQAYRDDPIGGLAREVASDQFFPKYGNSIKNFEKYLRIFDSSDEMVCALQQAWCEFKEIEDPR